MLHKLNILLLVFTYFIGPQLRRNERLAKVTRLAAHVFFLGLVFRAACNFYSGPRQDIKIHLNTQPR